MTRNMSRLFVLVLVALLFAWVQAVWAGGGQE